MVIKSEPTTNSSPAMPAATVCGNCGAEERQLLHQVRHRNIFRRLCTTCVLRLHPQAFCPTCFQVYTPTPPSDAVRACVKCYSRSHAHCVESAAASPNSYICPLCVRPNAPVFKLKTTKTESGEACRVMDRDAARMLLAAAKIASASMNKAAVLAKAEAERRVKEAAFTRKRAKEALEHVAQLEIKEKIRRKELPLGGAANSAMRRSGGIINNGGGYTAPPVKMATEIIPNMGITPAIVGGGSRPFVVAEETSNAGNVDRGNSNQLVARENEKMGAIGEGLVVNRGDTHAPMDVDEGGMIVNAAEVGEMKRDDNSSDLANLADMEIGGESANIKGENLDDAINDDGSGSNTEKKENNSGVETS